MFINSRFLAQPLTGVQRYSHELLRAWDELIEDKVLGQGVSIHCLAPMGFRTKQNWKNLKFIQAGWFNGNLWEQISLPTLSRNGVLFSPGNIGPYFHPNQIVTLHDTSVFAFPEAYSFSFRLKYQLIMRRMGRIARRIITVSNFSKQELIRWCQIPADKIEVIYEGCDHLQRVLADPGVFERKGIGRKRPYFLAVGSNSPHKNFQAVLRAFKKLGNQDIDLVITGGSFGKIFSANPLDMSPNAYRIGYVSDGELKALYENALALVFPSKYEGFGIPPLEAMACGCPVICSTAASLREVCGEAALYFDPEDIELLTGLMDQLAADPLQREQLHEAGTQQAEKFSWRQAAMQTWKVLEAYITNGASGGFTD